MATTNLGKILIINKGAWNAEDSYLPLDIVSVNNFTALYICKEANTGVDPTSDNTKWTLWIDINNVDAYSKAETDAKLAEKADLQDVPTKTSELENDSGFLTEHQSLEEYAKKTELPTKTSELENDSGFLTEHQSLEEYAKKSELPTKTSDLTNDSDFITNAVNDLVNYYTKSDTYNKTEVDGMIAAIKQLEIVVADELPTASADTMDKIYLIPSSDAGAQDSKDEYLTIRSGEEGAYTYSWEKIGNTRVDLSNYYTKTEVDTMLSDKADVEDILWEPGTGEGSIQVKGSNSSAESDHSVAEGLNTKTLVSEEETQGRGSHAEGIGSIAKASASHAEGNTTMTLGSYSHTEGSGTTAGGAASHAEGNGTVTNNFAEHAEGSHNVSNKASDNFGDEGNTISSVGIGTSLEDKKNALEIMQNGDAYLLGVGEYDGTNTSSADTLQEILNNKQDNLTAGDAIDITDDTIAVKYDNSTIKLNSEGKLEAEIPTITASTVDLEDGVSPLATGALYLVYEE